MVFCSSKSIMLNAASSTQLKTGNHSSTSISQPKKRHHCSTFYSGTLIAELKRWIVIYMTRLKVMAEVWGGGGAEKDLGLTPLVYCWVRTKGRGGGGGMAGVQARSDSEPESKGGGCLGSRVVVGTEKDSTVIP